MQCGNPLFLEWIGEWMENARENNNQAYYIYRKAYESMARYPTPFSHPAEAICLSGVGEKMVAKLEKKLIEYCEDNKLPMPTPAKQISRKKVNLNAGEEREVVEPKPKKARQKTHKPYVPVYRSGAYAILLTLLEAAATGVGASLTKYEITTRGQVHCDASLTNPEHGKFFTAWNSMKTLLEKGLVYRSGNKFFLTEEGTDMAEHMKAIAGETEPGLLLSPGAADQDSPPHASTSRWESRTMDWNRDAPSTLQDTTERGVSCASGATSSLDSISTVLTRAPKDRLPYSGDYSYTYDGDDLDGWDDIPNNGGLSAPSSAAPISNNDGDLNGWDDIPSNGGLSTLGSTATKSGQLYSTTSAVSSSLHSLGSNRDQPVSILSDSEDEKDDTMLNASAQIPFSQQFHMSSGSKTESSVAQTSNSSSLGLKRAPSLFKIPARPTPTTHGSRPEPTTYNDSIGDGFLASRSSDSLLLSSSASHKTKPPLANNHDSFPHLRNKSFSLGRSDSNLMTAEIKNMARFEPIEFHPGTFEICLVLDIREVRTQTDRDYIGQKLKDRGVNVVKRALDVGDVIWVARLNDPSFIGPEEIVLDYIVERKRMDDLISSIKDGRFNEQKFRLKRSGLGHVIYLVETHRVGETYEISPDAIRTATTSLQVHDNFFLRRTNHTDQTIDYLVSVTNVLKRLYEHKTLYAIPDEIINRATYLDLQNELKESYPDRTYLTSYKSFSSLNSKSDSTTVKDMFVKMLMTIRGVSSEKALEIARIYKTPRGLFSTLDSAGDITTPTQQKGRLAKSGSNIDKKRKISSALSSKIANIWYTDEYPLGDKRDD
ncbi:Crossover junction endonuclease mus81 [Mortierella sp. AM989]|nr:Crossover junction endonuclease mus81 [Mortierella sp. AM989]